MPRDAALLVAGWIVLLLMVPLALALAQQEVPSKPSWKYDAENARGILEVCAACHGKNGAGGKGGTYPRLAGLKQEYIAKQVRSFKARKRINIPMFPYATERELPESDILDIARLLSEIELPTERPPPDAVMTSYQRLLAVQAVFNVASVDGDIERGAWLYQEECSDCHGEEGWGEDDAPQLAGQYTEYLRRQLANFASGERENEDMEGVLDSLSAADFEDIFAFLASRDD